VVSDIQLGSSWRVSLVVSPGFFESTNDLLRGVKVFVLSSVCLMSGYSWRWVIPQRLEERHDAYAQIIVC
jgi:hypothetical protein